MKESELVKQINSFYENKGMIYMNEVRMGIGIPDILISNKIIRDLKVVTDYYELELYYFLIKTRIRTLSSLINRYGYSKEHVKKYTEELIKKNIIEVKGNKISITDRIDRENLGVNISIEAKLKDWKGALLQAERYLSFSEYSYVALPSIQVNKVEESNFEEKGIGLLSVSEDKIVEIIKPKKSKECNDILKYIATSYLNRNYLK